MPIFGQTIERTKSEEFNVFIAQYIGADRKDDVAGALWQGTYFSLASALMFVTWPANGP